MAKDGMFVDFTQNGYLCYVGIGAAHTSVTYDNVSHFDVPISEMYNYIDSK